MAPHSQPRVDSPCPSEPDWYEDTVSGTPPPMQAPQPKSPSASRSPLLRSPIPQPSRTSTPTSAVDPRSTAQKHGWSSPLLQPRLSRPGTTTSWESARQSPVQGRNAQSPVQHHDQPFHDTTPHSQQSSAPYGLDQWKQDVRARYTCSPSPQSPSGQSHRSGHAHWEAARPQSPPQDPPGRCHTTPFPPNSQPLQPPRQSPTVDDGQSVPLGSEALPDQHNPSPARDKTPYPRPSESHTPYGDSPGHPQFRHHTTSPQSSESAQSQFFPQQPTPHPSARSGTPMSHAQPPYQTSSWPFESQQPNSHPYYPSSQGQPSFLDHPHAQSPPPSGTYGPQMQPRGPTPFSWSPELQQPGSQPRFRPPHAQPNRLQSPGSSYDSYPQQASPYGHQEPPPQGWTQQHQPPPPSSPFHTHHYPGAPPPYWQHQYYPPPQAEPVATSRWAGNDNNNGSMDLDRQKSEYAIQLQQACEMVLKNLRKHVAFSKLEWADVLRAAPQSISIMSILFKTSASKAAARMKVGEDQRAIKDYEQVVGYLP